MLNEVKHPRGVGILCFVQHDMTHEILKTQKEYAALKFFNCYLKKLHLPPGGFFARQNAKFSPRTS